MTKYTFNGCVWPQMTQVVATNDTADSFQRIGPECGVTVAQEIPDSFSFFQAVLLAVSGLVLVLISTQTARKFYYLQNRRHWAKEEGMLNFLKMNLYSVGVFVLSGNPGKASLNYTKQGIAFIDFWNLVFLLLTAWSLSLRWLRTLADLASRSQFWYGKLNLIASVQCVVVLIFANLPFPVNNVHLGVQGLLAVLEVFMMASMNFVYGFHVIWNYRKQLKYAPKGSQSDDQVIRSQEKRTALIRLSALVFGASLLAILYVIISVQSAVSSITESRTEIILASDVVSAEDLKSQLVGEIVATSVIGIGFVSLFLVVFRKVSN